MAARRSVRESVESAGFLGPGEAGPVGSLGPGR